MSGEFPLLRVLSSFMLGVALRTQEGVTKVDARREILPGHEDLIER